MYHGIKEKSRKHIFAGVLSRTLIIKKELLCNTGMHSGNTQIIREHNSSRNVKEPAVISRLDGGLDFKSSVTLQNEPFDSASSNGLQMFLRLQSGFCTSNKTESCFPSLCYKRLIKPVAVNSLHPLSKNCLTEVIYSGCLRCCCCPVRL